MGRKSEDLTGKKFGDLRVIKRDDTKTHRIHWLVRCRCGKVFSKRSYNVKQGQVCNWCAQGAVDITDKEFGGLKVIGIDKKTSAKRKATYWFVRCKCGKTFSKHTAAVTSGVLCSNCSRVRIEVGYVTGKLTVVDKCVVDGRTLWVCKCKCGCEALLPQYVLYNNKVKSCGCARGDALPDNFKDITGQVFGRLTAIERDGHDYRGLATWRCICSCQDGAEVQVTGASLRRGNVKSCGCLSRELVIKRNKERRTDMAGRKYGYLTVRREVHREEPGVWWLCDCDCGNIAIVASSQLVYYSTRSCGCMSEERSYRHRTMLKEDREKAIAMYLSGLSLSTISYKLKTPFSVVSRTLHEDPNIVINLNTAKRAASSVSS